MTTQIVFFWHWHTLITNEVHHFLSRYTEINTHFTGIHVPLHLISLHFDMDVGIYFHKIKYTPHSCYPFSADTNRSQGPLSNQKQFVTLTSTDAEGSEKRHDRTPVLAIDTRTRILFPPPLPPPPPQWLCSPWKRLGRLTQGRFSKSYLDTI
jgi:hypothetical protein